MNAPARTTATAAVGVDGWERYWAQVGNEEWLAARELLDLSARLREVFGAFVNQDPKAGPGELELDWDAAAEQVEREALSSTEYKLARLVLGLTTGQPFPVESLCWMGSWQGEVWRVLVQWASGGALTTAPGTGASPASRAAARRLTDRAGVWR